MTITISPAEGADTKAIILLNELAFPTTYAALYGGRLKPEAIEAQVAERLKSLLKEEETNNNQEKPPLKRPFAFKAVDDETGELVGEARWMVFYEDEKLTKTIQEEALERVKTPSPQLQIEPMKAWSRMLSKVKREVIPVSETGVEVINEEDLDKVTALRKRVYLHVLAVHPDHQRKGIGRKLLQWGLDEADRLGMIAYLEASTAGRKLYEDTGFESVKDVALDMTPFGGLDEIPLTVS